MILKLPLSAKCYLSIYLYSRIKQQTIKKVLCNFTYYLRVIIFTIICTSCVGNNNKEVNVNIISVEDITSQTKDITEIFSEVNYIPLETTAESIFGEVNKIISDSNKIFISDLRSIFIFDNNGLFISVINRHGSASNEYLSIDDFSVTGDNILILDRNKKRVLFYDMSGSFIKSLDVDLFSSAISITDEEDIILKIDNDELPDNRLVIINNETGVKGKAMYEVDKTKAEYLNIMFNQNFFINASTSVFTEPMNNCIYSIKDKKVLYKLEFCNNNPTEDFLTTKFSDIYEYMTTFKENNYASGIYGYMENEDKILLRFLYNSKLLFCEYDKNSSKVIFTGSITYNKKSPNDMFFHNNNIFTLVNIDEEQTIINDEDNPVLIHMRY